MMDISFGAGSIPLGFLGSGTMAQALSKGFITAGIVQASEIFVSGKGEANLQLISVNGVKVCKKNVDLVKSCRVLFLAVKPNVALDVIREISNHVTSEHLFISVAAGISIDQMQELLPLGSRVVRVASNTPVAVMSAVSVFCAGCNATSQDCDTVRRLLSCVGSCFQLDEKHLDTVTALSGSGPAYVSMAIEALADGGVKMGLARDVALTIAAQTVQGTAKLILDSGKHPGAVKDSICSPGGCTIAGVHELEKAGFRGALISAIETGTLVARQLGKKS